MALQQLFRRRTDQHRPHHAPEHIAVRQEVVALAGDQRQIGMIWQMLKGIESRIRENHARLAHFVGVLLAIQMHHDLIAIGQVFEIDKRPRQPVGVRDVRSDD